MNKLSEIIDVFFLVSILSFLVIYPILGKSFLDEKFQLDGVVEESEKPEMQIKGLMDGSYQEGMETDLHSHQPGKDLLVRFHNQVLYSVFNTSSNDNVIIGKDKYLFEPWYIYYYLNIYGQPQEEEINVLVDKITTLNQILMNEDKELYIFITPAKARYYKDTIPGLYQKYDNSSNVKLAYDMFTERLGESSLNYFDSINYINANRDNFDFPLYYPTGIHWSRALGYTVVEEFNQYLCEKSKYDLGHIEVSLEKTSTCEAPDADLYNVLNLLLPVESTGNEYYGVNFNVVPGTQQPSVFYRGGSFMGQSLNILIAYQIFGANIHFENNYYFTDYYSNQQTLSSFTSYDELDVCGYLKNSDILILEVNETAISNMSFGFIDYLLENYK